MKIKLLSRTDAPETNLYVEVLTKNNKPLGNRNVMLLIPGGPGGNHTVFDAIKDELLMYSDIVLFDPRGCGYSDYSDSRFCSISQYINDIEAIRKNFQLKKIILLGGSYGAMASVGYAIKFGLSVGKLILIAGAPSFRFIEIAQKNLKERGAPEQIKAAKDLWNGTFKDAEHFKEYYKVMASLYLYKPPAIRNSLPTIKPNIPYNTDITNFGFSDFLKKFDFESELNKISCETLILSGKDDWINDPSQAALMGQKIPNSTVKFFEQCGHFIWEDQRIKFFESISEFLTMNQCLK
jgi:proline iminopeptidase